MATALLLMDFQEGIVEQISDGREELLARANDALRAARSEGLLIVLIRVALRSADRSVSLRNKVFSALGNTGAFGEDDPATQISPSLEVNDADLVITKRRVSAFAGSDLEVVLRAHDVTELVVGGIATSGVVLSTVRQAADLDFGLTVLSDACFDRDPEVHRVLLAKVFPRQALVCTVSEWSARR